MLARFKLSAALLNDINLDKITLGVSGITNDSLLTNIRIYDDTTAVASLKRFTNRTRDGLTGVATFRTPSTITQGTTKTFRIVADVAASGQQGQQFKTGMVAIEQPPSVTVVGLPLYGPLATIVKPVRR
jgi:hypothetical protein